jgi:hypothetical protein
MEYLWEVFDTAVRAYYHDQFVWNVVVIIIMIAALGSVSFPELKLWGKNLEDMLGYIPRRRGKNMRRARRDFIRSDTIDALVDHIEKRVAQGDYTRKEAKELYREARKAWEIKDLFPNPQLLKENIQKRINSGANNPVPLPGSTMKEKKLSFSRNRPVVAKA